VRGQTSFDADGRPTAMSGVSVDITERRAAEEHRKLLSRELNHRVKNSLSMVQSIFGQTLKHASSIEEARETVNARIQAMAAAQDVLLEQGWTSSQLSHVVHAALKPFEDGRQRIRHRGPEVRVSAAAATSFSLAFHELATNAVKHGALSTDSGRVEILWEVRDGVLHLTWEEIGGPPVVTPTRRGFGTTIIEKALAASIQGSATLHYRPAGLVMEVVTDVAKLKSDDL
jgi:two-component sensor histidine kinase